MSEYVHKEIWSLNIPGHENQSQVIEVQSCMFDIGLTQATVFCDLNHAHEPTGLLVGVVNKANGSINWEPLGRILLDEEPQLLLNKIMTQSFRLGKQGPCQVTFMGQKLRKEITPTIIRQRFAVYPNEMCDGLIFPGGGLRGYTKREYDEILLEDGSGSGQECASDGGPGQNH